MTTVVTVTDKNTPFAYLTVQLGIEEFARNRAYAFKSYDKKTFYQRRLDPISDRSIVIVEAAYLQEGRFSVQELRQHFTDAKIVVLGSDTFYHISRGSFQFNGVADCDLFLDLMQSCALEYSKYTKTDIWNWTTTKPLNDYLLKFLKDNENIEPTIDFISVLGAHTIHRGYRKDMIEFINNNGLTFTRGASDGYHDIDMDKLYKSYLQSKYTLGTSSHDNGSRSVKGFRDYIGMILKRPLLVDDFPDSLRQFEKCGVFYKYEDLNTLLESIKLYPYGSEAYNKLGDIQQEWVINNTIEKQLEDILERYKIL